MTVSFSTHAESKQDEAKIIKILHEAWGRIKNDVGNVATQLSTTHHGNGDIDAANSAATVTLDTPPPDASPVIEPPDAATETQGGATPTQ